VKESLRGHVVTWEDIKWHDIQTAEDSKRSLMLMLPTMIGSLKWERGEEGGGGWRWLSKCCRMPYHYSAIPQFQELFDWPS
jgi:hypothetical protein